MNKTLNTKRMVETALLFAMAAILSLIKLFVMPWGGSVTLCSMLPIILISYRYGVKWGIYSAFVYALLQMVIDIGTIKALSGLTLVGSLLFDYLLGFGALGLGGLFRKKLKNPGAALAAGSVAAILGRFVCSFLSGFILWGSYAEGTLRDFGDSLANAVLDNFSGWGLSAIYSLLYNATYIIPELIITVIIGLMISMVPVISKRYNMN